MATVIKKKAALISVRELQPIVDRAIKEAGLQVDDHGLVVRWDLAGRILRDLPTAEKFAASVSKTITAHGHDVVPAVLQIDKTIIAGFYERVNTPQTRAF